MKKEYILAVVVGIASGVGTWAVTRLIDMLSDRQRAAAESSQRMPRRSRILAGVGALS